MEQHLDLVAHLVAYRRSQRVGTPAALGVIETIRQFEEHPEASGAVR
jgi:hypothetical protein